jgi:hypothetical protein
MARQTRPTRGNARRLALTGGLVSTEPVRQIHPPDRKTPQNPTRMGKLTIRSRLSAEERDLLEAAGFDEDRDLTRVGPQRIHEELAKANEFLEIMDEAPTLETVESWVAELKPPEKPAAEKAPGETPTQSAKEAAKSSPRKTAETPAANSAAAASEIEASVPDAAPETVEEPSALPTPAAEAPDGYYNFELDPDVQDMLARAPVALPLPNRLLAEKQIPPAEIPAAELLTSAPGDLDVRVSGHSAKPSKTEPNAPKSRMVGLVNVAESRRHGKREIDISRIRSMDHARREPAPDEPAAKRAAATRKTHAQHERLQLLRTARESTNRGKDPNSRRFVRGVLHDRPVLVVFGSLAAILFELCVPAAIIVTPLLILADTYPDTFPAVGRWLLVFPLLVPVLGLLYLTFSTRVKCRVCAQKVLWPKHCRKHVKAHHLPGLGHILPLAFHTLTFGWFTCTFCGTAVRIKK